MFQFLPRDVLDILVSNLTTARAVFASWLSCKASMACISKHDLCELVSRRLYDIRDLPFRGMSSWEDICVKMASTVCQYCLLRPPAVKCINGRCGSCCSDPECRRHVCARVRHRRIRQGGHANDVLADFVSDHMNDNRTTPLLHVIPLRWRFMFKINRRLEIRLKQT